MSKDFPNYDGREETIVDVHRSKIELQEGLNISLSRYYCSSCKKKIHCYVKIDKETKEAVIHNTCRDSLCECKCKTHYACKSCGYLHPYGQSICDKVIPEKKPNATDDAIFDNIMDEWREQQEK